MAKIVIDARMWNESGVGRYIRNLVGNLQALDKKNEYFLILLEKDFQSIVLTENFHKVLGDFRWYGVNEQIRLLAILGQISPDLVHFPHFNVPILYQGKFVVTIHDLIHQHFQMNRATTRDPITYRIKHFGYTTIFKNAIEKSKKILTPSNYVKNLMRDECGVNGDKIIVTPEAVDGNMVKLINKMSDSESLKIIKRLGIKKPYIYYVGNAHPHKNVEGLIQAFFRLKDIEQAKENNENVSVDLQLVLSGNDHYFWQKIKEKFPKKDISYTGFVSEEELVALYKNAEVYVIPSFEEGFGIPMLEAMAAGCPVVSSDTASLPEVGSDAAIYFDPHDFEDMREKILDGLRNIRLRDNLIRKGKDRVNEFSWQKLAKQTLEVYQEIL